MDKRCLHKHPKIDATQTNATSMRNTDVMAALDLSRQTLDKPNHKDVALKLRDQALEESSQAIDRAKNEGSQARRSNDLTIALGKIDTIEKNTTRLFIKSLESHCSKCSYEPYRQRKRGQRGRDTETRADC